LAEEGYVVAGAKMFCNKGSHFRRLDLPRCHGVYLREKAATNEDDRVPMVNIQPFGVCLSDRNTSEMMQTSHREDMLPFGNVPLPIVGARCTPSVSHKWIDAKEDSLVDGKPALTIRSTLLCHRGGGVIAFVNDGQEV
jgi:hypothetical protein